MGWSTFRVLVSINIIIVMVALVEDAVGDVAVAVVERADFEERILPLTTCRFVLLGSCLDFPYIGLVRTVACSSLLVAARTTVIRYLWQTDCCCRCWQRLNGEEEVHLDLPWEVGTLRWEMLHSGLAIPLEAGEIHLGDFVELGLEEYIVDRAGQG